MGEKGASEHEAGGAHEARCRRCGRCCLQKLNVEGRIIYLDAACRHLDPETRLCRVYERRFEANPDCLGVEEGIRRGVFPADCPYVAELAGYRPPVVTTAGLDGAPLSPRSEATAKPNECGAPTREAVVTKDRQDIQDVRYKGVPGR